MATLTFSLPSITIECCACGMPWAVPAEWYHERRRDHVFFYCPNGHSQHYTSKTKEEQLRDELAREKHLREQAQAARDDARRERDHTEMRRRGTMGALRKIQKRVKHGVCPCCNRTFQNVARHMSTQHPHFAPAVSIEA